MTVVIVDLAGLEAADLAGVRLGAQIMGHKAAVIARLRVEGFFGALAVAAAAERSRLGEGRARTAAVALPFEERDSPADARADRRLLIEYLDLLSANGRLSPGVRGVYESIRHQVAEPGDEEWPETMQ